jgi:hypothetical protein
MRIAQTRGSGFDAALAAERVHLADVLQAAFGDRDLDLVRIYS